MDVDFEFESRAQEKGRVELRQSGEGGRVGPELRSTCNGFKQVIVDGAAARLC